MFLDEDLPDQVRVVDLHDRKRSEIPAHQIAMLRAFLHPCEVAGPVAGQMAQKKPPTGNDGDAHRAASISPRAKHPALPSTLEFQVDLELLTEGGATWRVCLFSAEVLGA